MTDGMFEAPSPADPKPDDNLADPTLLAKRLEDKDTFIAQLERENAEMRDALAKQKTIDELLAEARKPTAPQPSPQAEAKPAADPKADGIDPDDLVARVEQALEAKTAKQRTEANANVVRSHLLEQYGTKEAADKAVAERAAELGVGVQFLLETAMQSPDAFYQLVKIDGPKSQRAPQSDVNTTALKQHAPGVKEGTDAYYRTLRKQIGDAAYFTPKIQNQRMKDALKLGDAFFH